MFKRYLSCAVGAMLCCAAAVAQDKPKEKATEAAKGAAAQATGGEPDMKAMMEMMEKIAAPGDNHKLLADMVGEWTYVNKWWMDPSAEPEQSTGTMKSEALFGGRYIVEKYTGSMKMPGPDGKPVEKEFLGMSLTGYDNVKGKFVNTWIDNMGTGIFMSEGDYEAGTKTFTYRGEAEFMPGMKSKIRMAVKCVDKDKHVFEWFEDRGDGNEMRTMEITYTRKK